MSNVQSLVIVIFLIFFPMAACRECYKCHSRLSWKDCESKSRKVTCDNSYSHCFKLSGYMYSKPIYIKSCAYTCRGAGDMIDCGEPGIECEVKCCSTDYCNGGIGPTITPSTRSGCMLFSACIVTISFCFGLLVLVFDV